MKPGSQHRQSNNLHVDEWHKDVKLTKPVTGSSTSRMSLMQLKVFWYIHILEATRIRQNVMRFSEDQIKMHIPKLCLPFGWVLSIPLLLYRKLQEIQAGKLKIQRYCPSQPTWNNSHRKPPCQCNPKLSCGRFSGDKHIRNFGGGGRGRNESPQKNKLQNQIPWWEDFRSSCWY